MRSDPRQTAALGRLTRIQGLRLAAHAQALDDAQQAHRDARSREETAAKALAEHEAEMHEWLGCGQFDPVLFAMKGQQLVAHAGRHHAAQAAREQTAQQRRDDEQQWQASRYQRDWLATRHREAARKLHRKLEDRQALDTTSLLLLTRQGDTP